MLMLWAGTWTSSRSLLPMCSFGFVFLTALHPSDLDLPSRWPFRWCNSLSLSFDLLYFSYATYKECRLLTYNLLVCSPFAIPCAAS